MAQDDSKLAAWLLDRFGVEGEAAGLLDEDLVVGYVEGRLTTEERDAAEGLLALDPEARRILGLAQPGPLAPSTSRWPAWALPLAAAAALLLAVGAIWLLSREDDPSSNDPEARLLALAERLETGHPTMFASLREGIANTERVALPAIERGGVRILTPRGEILAGTLELRWEAVAGEASYHVQISPEGAAPLFTATAKGTAMTVTTDQPGARAMQPGGRYIVEVRVRTAFGEAAGSVVFRRATAAAEREHAEAREAIDALAPAAERDLLLAYYALSRERYEEARAALLRLESSGRKDERVERLRTLLGPVAD